jgi:hypothetical protein
MAAMKRSDDKDPFRPGQWDSPDRLRGLPTDEELSRLATDRDEFGDRLRRVQPSRSPSARAERSRTAARSRAPRGDARRKAIKKILTEGLIPASPTK